MKLDQVLEYLAENLSGLSAKRYAEQLSMFHRIQASSGFDQALEVVQQVLEKCGMETHIHEYPADGTTRIHDWIAPIGWELETAELWQLAPERACLGRSQNEPLMVCPMSPGGIAEGKLVHVGAGANESDYEGIDVEGYLVLASGTAMKVVRKAASKGAVGVIVYPGKERALASQHLRVYQGLKPTKSDLDSLIPAFSISRWCSDQLLACMEAHDVLIRGQVDARFTSNPLRVLETCIEGTDPGQSEVLLVAHLCHPYQSANDNASGSGLLMEVACQLAQMRIALPLYSSVRMLWVPEFSGSLAWSIDHSDILKRTMYTINLDMVGQSPELIGEPLRVYRVPNSIPTFMNACIEPILERIAAKSREIAPLMVKGSLTPRTIIPQGSSRPLHWIFDLPASGSDHLSFMSAPYHIPSFMVGHEDPYWHTSEDTIEKVDPARLKQTGLLTAVLAQLPSIAQDEADRLANWTMKYAQREMSEAAELGLDIEGVPRERLMHTALEVAIQRLHSLEEFLNHCTTDATVNWDEGERRLRCCNETQFDELDQGSEFSASYPRRLMDGPLSSWYMDGLAEEDVRFLEKTLSADGRPMSEFLLELCDNRRNMTEISALLSLDLHRLVTPAEVVRGLKLLAVAGYVEITHKTEV